VLINISIGSVTKGESLTPLMDEYHQSREKTLENNTGHTGKKKPVSRCSENRAMSNNINIVTRTDNAIQSSTCSTNDDTEWEFFISL
jgi:hypothetical protein